MLITLLSRVPRRSGFVRVRRRSPSQLWIRCLLSTLSSLIHTHILSSLLSFALTHSPLLCCFCQWWHLSWVPSRHVAVATGVKGWMKEQAPSLYFLPQLSPSPSPRPTTYLCSSTGSLASIHSNICHPFVASHSGGQKCSVYGSIFFHLRSPASCWPHSTSESAGENRRLTYFLRLSQPAEAPMQIHNVLCVYSDHVTARGSSVS